MAFEKIKRIFCEEFEIEEEDITLDAVIRDDFSLDEIDIYDLVMSVEDEFNKELPDEELEKIITVGDLLKFVEEN